MTHLLWFLAGVLVTMFVVVVWSCLVLAARSDAQAEAMADLIKDRGEVQR